MERLPSSPANHHHPMKQPRQRHLMLRRAYDPYEIQEDDQGNEGGVSGAGGNFLQPPAETSLGAPVPVPPPGRFPASFPPNEAQRTSSMPSSVIPHPQEQQYPPRDGIVATSELPQQLRDAFPFRYFNLVQSECFDAAFNSSEPLVVVAPTGAGKTGVLDLALARLLMESAGRGLAAEATGSGGEMPLSSSRQQQQRHDAFSGAKALYIAPSRALVQERVADWKRRFGPLGAACAELTGDAGENDGDDDGGLGLGGGGSSTSTAALLDAATIICATPEKLDSVTRHRGGRRAIGASGIGASFSRSAAFIGDVAMVLLDEVHLLNDVPRGATLEAVVARLRVLGASPELSGSPLSRARFVAVSATMPNANDVGAWLGNAPCSPSSSSPSFASVFSGGVLPATVRAFGDEVRPVPLRTLVRAYPDTRTDFLFEKSLNRPLIDVLAEHGAGRPCLVFCASRNGASETAKYVAAAWRSAGRIANGSGSNGGRHASSSSSSSSSSCSYDLRQLEAVASSISSRPLADCVRFGVGYHHAGLEPRDRAMLEAAFIARQLPCLCTTSTLAVGVNLPAYLVVIKGTRRWGSTSEAEAARVGLVGRGGNGGGESASTSTSSTTAPKSSSASSGFVEYDANTILQMCGRAGRPQFDTSGVAVVMTQSSAAQRFLELVRGSRTLDSKLEEFLPEHLNAEIVLRTVPDVPDAVRWLKATFLWARVRSDPVARGFPRSLAAAAVSAADDPMAAAAAASALERLATQRYISSTVNSLVSGGFATSSLGGEDGSGVGGYALAPTVAGQLAARHYVRLPTLAAARDATPRHASLPDLLEVMCGAAEFSGIPLRRSEKKQLADMNKRAAAEGRPFVPAEGTTTAAAAVAAPKPKKTISTTKEKLLVLVSDALGEQPTDALDYSMRSELDGVLKTGKRIATCFAALFAAEAQESCGGGGGGKNNDDASASSSPTANLVNTARFAATANAHRLARSLRAGCWDGSGAEARQLPGVGRTLGSRLAEAGLGTLAALLSADGRDVERATGRAFPFGHQTVAEATAMAPSDVRVRVSRPELRRGDATAGGGARGGAGGASWEFSVTLTRVEGSGDDEDGDDGAAPPLRRRKRAASSAKCSYAKLVVGIPENDALLLCETVSLDTFRSPYTVRLAARAVASRVRAGGGILVADAARPPSVVAAVLHDRVVGLDVVATSTDPSCSSAEAAKNKASTTLSVPPSSRPPPSSPSPGHPSQKPVTAAATPAAAMTTALAAAATLGRQTSLFESFRFDPEEHQRQHQRQQRMKRLSPPSEPRSACVPEGGEDAAASATAVAETAPAAPTASYNNNRATNEDDEFADVFDFL